jgi:hypothetical protein
MRLRKPRTVSFEISVNNRTYTVKATPYAIATGETRFRVSYNNNPVHIFGWDDGLDRLADIESVTEVLPPVIEMAISEKLQVHMKQAQQAA